jgi:hypothetical protein
MKAEISLHIRGREVRLAANESKSGRVLGEISWQDERDLADQFFSKLDVLLRRHRLPFVDVENFRFDCDSPYFDPSIRGKTLEMEDFDSTGLCGFTAWQTGEAITKVLDFANKLK